MQNPLRFVEFRKIIFGMVLAFPTSLKVIFSHLFNYSETSIMLMLRFSSTDDLHLLDNIVSPCLVDCLISLMSNIRKVRLRA